MSTRRPKTARQLQRRRAQYEHRQWATSRPSASTAPPCPTSPQREDGPVAKADDLDTVYRIATTDGLEFEGSRAFLDLFPSLEDTPRTIVTGTDDAS